MVKAVAPPAGLSRPANILETASHKPITLRQRHLDGRVHAAG